MRVFCPQRGVHKRLVETVSDNARQGLAQHRIKWLDNLDIIQQATNELEEELSLPLPLRRMECYDISHIQGSNTVGSMVVFEDGRPKQAHYRRFKVKTVDGVDDFESMREVLRRRFKRMASARAAAKKEGDEDAAQGTSWGAVPDLVLIDGGKGQLSAALEVFLELGLDDIPLASLAQGRNEWPLRCPTLRSQSFCPAIPKPCTWCSESAMRPTGLPSPTTATCVAKAA